MGAINTMSVTHIMGIRMNSVLGLRICISALCMAVACAASGQASDGLISGEPAAQIAHQHPQQPTLPDGNVSIVPPDLAKLHLAEGMQLRFSVYDTPEMTTTLRIAADGTVAVPLAGPVYVVGMTLPDAKRAIETALTSGQYLVKPQVSLDVAQIAPGYLTILGEVQAPGRFQILAPISLLEAIAQAGGETPNAGAEIDIHRPSMPPEVFEPVSNVRSEQSHLGTVQVGPGDTVNVTRAGIVYVLGEVHRPGGYLMLNRGSLNALEALALAQGTLLEAATGSIRILHRQGNTLTEESFQLNPSTKGTAAPPILHDMDIVYVPSSKLKSFLVNGSSIIGAATSSIIYRIY